jgi:hypothetical protein
MTEYYTQLILDLQLMDIDETSHPIFKDTKKKIHSQVFGSLLFLEGFVPKEFLYELFFLMESGIILTNEELRYSIEITDDAVSVDRHTILLSDSHQKAYISFMSFENLKTPIKNALENKFGREDKPDIEEDFLTRDIIEKTIRILKTKKEANEYNSI